LIIFLFHDLFLCQLLQEFEELKTSKVLLEVEQHLKIVNPSDMKTIAVGQLTVYMALVNSGRMQTTNASHLRSIVDTLLKLESEKTYLRAGANEVLTQMIEKVSLSARYIQSLHCDLMLLRGIFHQFLSHLDFFPP
jgi:hypothetical protein